MTKNMGIGLMAHKALLIACTSLDFRNTLDTAGSRQSTVLTSAGRREVTKHRRRSVFSRPQNSVSMARRIWMRVSTSASRDFNVTDLRHGHVERSGASSPAGGACVRQHVHLLILDMV